MPWGAECDPAVAENVPKETCKHQHALSSDVFGRSVPATKNTAHLFPVLASEGRPREQDVSVATPVCCRLYWQ